MLSSSVTYKEEHNNNSVNFSDYSNEEDNVNFNSTWKRVKKTSVNSCQTEPIKYENKAVQSLKLKDAGVISSYFILNFHLENFLFLKKKNIFFINNNITIKY